MMFKKIFFFDIFQKLKSYFKSGYYADSETGFLFVLAQKIFSLEVELRLG